MKWLCALTLDGTRLQKASAVCRSRGSENDERFRTITVPAAHAQGAIHEYTHSAGTPRGFGGGDRRRL
jgi:hypothetical protein